MTTPDLPALPIPAWALRALAQHTGLTMEVRAYGDARAAAERERMNAHAVVLAETARVVERERCAKICDRTLRDHYASQRRPASEEVFLFAAVCDCAAAIRAEPKEQQP